jgi:hypothetical protein
VQRAIQRTQFHSAVWFPYQLLNKLIDCYEIQQVGHATGDAQLQPNTGRVPHLRPEIYLGSYLGIRLRSSSPGLIRLGKCFG